MGLVTSPPHPTPPHFITAIKLPSPALPLFASMSQDFHHHHHHHHPGGLFSFSEAFDRSNNEGQQHHLAQQTLLEETSSADEASVSTATAIYGQHHQTDANVLSDMFNFLSPPPPPSSATELFAGQMQQAGGYHPVPQRDSIAVAAADWHMSADHSAAAMQLFLMNPPQAPTQRYPSDADKHMLARQAGLSRGQVSNWFINARVRLWKPMVEEMYQQEAKEEDNNGETSESNQEPSSSQQQQQQVQSSDRRPSVQHHSSSENFPPPPPPLLLDVSNDDSPVNPIELGDNPMYRMADYSAAAASLGPAAASCLRFGTSGDVSLTLGLRHVGNAARTEKGQYYVSDFRNC